MYYKKSEMIYDDGTYYKWKTGDEHDNLSIAHGIENKGLNRTEGDDIPCNFNYNSLYTQITGGINAQKKGSKAEMIEREESPKFLITTNYLFRCDQNDASTVARFCEYKIKPYYNVSFSPKDEFKESFFEDWNNSEWNKFYSYVYRCVRYYLVSGIQRIHYDKTEDNFKAIFGDDAKLSEMERIIDVIINYRKQTSFTVSDFLSIYNSLENPLRNEKMFHSKNAKTLINHFLSMNKHLNYIYGQQRTWWKS